MFCETNVKCIFSFSITNSYLSACLSVPFGTSPENVSFLSCLHIVRACGGMKTLLGAQRAIQEMKIKGGAAVLCEKMAKDLGSESYDKYNDFLF